MSPIRGISGWRGWAQSALWQRFITSPTALLAAAVALMCLVGALGADWVAPSNPNDLATLHLADARMPPAWLAQGRADHLLGTDDQGRDMLSAVLFGARVSLIVALTSVVASLLLGVTLGLLAGLAGGRIDALLMRVCDVMLSFPAVLVALLIDGLVRASFSGTHDLLAMGVLVMAIALTGWVPYARTVRASARVERDKDYVQAARLIGVPPVRVARRHVLPNVMGPVMVLATLQIASAILLEATLSFLGVGVPPTSPSLGTLIRNGNDALFSGEWWMTLVPGAMLVAIALSVNLLGDWLRDALNPRLS